MSISLLKNLLLKKKKLVELFMIDPRDEDLLIY